MTYVCLFPLHHSQANVDLHLNDTLHPRQNTDIPFFPMHHSKANVDLDLNDTLHPRQ